MPSSLIFQYHLLQLPPLLPPPPPPHDSHSLLPLPLLHFIQHRHILVHHQHSCFILEVTILAHAALLAFPLLVVLLRIEQHFETIVTLGDLLNFMPPFGMPHLTTNLNSSFMIECQWLM